MRYKIIAFDADDTLWENEHYFMHVEEVFCAVFQQYTSREAALDVLNETGKANRSLYGFGIKSFVLNMIEAGLQITGGSMPPELMGQLIRMGKEMIDKPVDLMDGIEEVLGYLQDKSKLIVITKGDLLDQERKLRKSGLTSYFHHIEIMSEKDEKGYLRLIRQLGIEPHELLMVGNSLQSDILPVLQIGGYAIHVPYRITNVYERADPVDHPRLRNIGSVRELLHHLD